MCKGAVVVKACLDFPSRLRDVGTLLPTQLFGGLSISNHDLPYNHGDMPVELSHKCFCDLESFCTPHDAIIYNVLESLEEHLLSDALRLLTTPRWYLGLAEVAYENAGGSCLNDRTTHPRSPMNWGLSPDVFSLSRCACDRHICISEKLA